MPYQVESEQAFPALFLRRFLLKVGESMDRNSIDEKAIEFEDHRQPMPELSKTFVVHRSYLIDNTDGDQRKKLFRIPGVVNGNYVVLLSTW